MILTRKQIKDLDALFENYGFYAEARFDVIENRIFCFMYGKHIDGCVKYEWSNDSSMWIKAY